MSNPLDLLSVNDKGTQSMAQMRRTYGSEAVDFIGLAISAGWRAHFAANGNNVTLYAPGEPSPKTIKISGANKSRGGHYDYKAMARQVIRYGDKPTIARMTEMAKDPSVTQEDFENEMRASTAAKLVAAKIELEAVDREVAATQQKIQDITDGKPITTTGAFGQKVEKPYRNPVKNTIGDVLRPEEIEAMQAVAVEPPRRWIVTTRPALMHKSLSQSGGKSYPSKTSVERKWSDGVIDYECAVCGEVSDNKRSFAGSHWGKHVREGLAQPVTQEEIRDSIVDDPNYTEHAFERGPGERRQGKVQAVFDFLASLDVASMSKEELAELFVQRFLPDSDSHGGVGPIEPLTDSQVLDRIRRLVDHGTYAEQEATIEDLSIQLNEKAERLAMQRAQHDEELAVANARREAAEGSLRALHAMIGEAIVQEDSNGSPATDA